MGIFTLIAAIVAAVGLAIIVAKLFERRFNRQLGLPITFEPSGWAAATGTRSSTSAPTGPN